MNLLVLDQFSQMGGAQQALAELLPALRERGWSGTVALPGEGELFDCARAAGFATEQISCGPYHSGKKTPADAVRFAADTARLATRVRQLAGGADLIYVNGPRVLPGAALARTGLPLLFHAHSLLPSGVRGVVRAALRGQRFRVIAVCEFVAEPWRQIAGTDAVRVIYNGVAGPPLPLWRGGSLRIGCIGRIAPEKGQREFVLAARMIASELPGASFSIFGATLFGSSGGYEAQVRREAQGLPITFAGWRDDVCAALAELDLLLVPSAAQEATTRVILEAYAAGVPVVAYRSGGIPEIVRHRVTGFLVDSAEEMARVSVDALRGSRLPEVSRAERCEWEARFTQDRCHRELLDALWATANPQRTSSTAT